MTGRRRIRQRFCAAAVAGGLVVSGAGCGALPPEAPVDAASLISRALTTISATCGESYRLQAFNPHPDLSGLEASATSSARKLAGLRRRHPDWVYQDRTLAQLVTLSRNLLDSCALRDAARALH